MNIADKCIVSFHYTLTNDAGEKLDTSSGQDPLKYLHGASNIVPGLEKALEGRKTGDTLKVEVQPEDGYGDVNPDMIKTIPPSAFEGVDDVRPGMQFQAQGPEGQIQMITVVEVTDEGIKINGNHPLAGQVLHFDVTIKDVREASEEELKHGHAH